MNSNCSTCQSELEIQLLVFDNNVVPCKHFTYCKICDRKPDRRKEHLGGLLDAIKEDMMGADLLTKLWLEIRKRQIDDNIDEATN